ncbi:MAG: 30S ribosomal protein S16 [Candidatus Latescibacteria bacterium]|nr:30S ribosomal protein S16 [Candidatus Latescibacterota bacterium]
MALAIRLRRMGAKKRPFYRIVVAESRMPRDGRYIESVGHYNPLTDPPDVKVDEERLFGWLTKGAKPTDTTRSLLSRIGVYAKWTAQRRGQPVPEGTEGTALVDATADEDAAPKKATGQRTTQKTVS